MKEALTLIELKRLKIGELREILRAENKVARGKASALIRAGFEGEMTLPPIKDYTRTPAKELIRAVADIQIYNRSKISTVKGMNEFIDQTLDTLHKHKYNFVDRGNLADFGRFMNMVRDLHGEKGFPSRQVANMYLDKQRLNISNATIKRKFSEFLTSESGIADLQSAFDDLKLPEDRKRISSTEVLNKMVELGLIEEE